MIKNSNIHVQNVYLRDVNGDYIRHIWDTTEFWRLSPDKQVAIRYQDECQNRHGADAALYADIGYVRAFAGTREELAAFLMSLPDQDAFFQDSDITDDSCVSVEDYDDPDDLLAALESFDCIEEFEGHLLLFGSAGDPWFSDIAI